MHAHYQKRVGEPKFRFGERRSKQPVRVPKVTTLVDEIRFWDSVIAIKKRRRGLPLSQHW
jgi:hypothetical protein